MVFTVFATWVVPGEEYQKNEKILNMKRLSYGRSIAVNASGSQGSRAFGFHPPINNLNYLRLFNDGILYSRLKGKVRLFGINPRYPFKKELESLFEKILNFIPEEDKEKFYTPRLRPRRTGKPI